MTVNVLVTLGAVLYLTGGFNPAKTKLGVIIGAYAAFVVLGFGFTIFKYAVLQGLDVDLAFAFDKLKIVIVISGLLALGWGGLAYLGNRRLEKLIE